MEPVAVILSLLGVYLTAKEKVACWPIGIAGCVIYTLIFYKVLLFADAALQVLYVVIGFYGWYEWLYGGGNNNNLTISKTPTKTFIYLGITAIFSSVILIAVLFRINDSLPYWDGITAVLSIIATWMMAKKLIENWILWIVTDLLYIAPYILKHLQLTALLYFAYIVLAIFGFYSWKKRTQTTSV